MKLLEDHNIAILETIEEWDALITDISEIYGARNAIYLMDCPGGYRVILKSVKLGRPISIRIEDGGQFKFLIFGKYKVMLQNNTNEQRDLYQMVRLSLI